MRIAVLVDPDLPSAKLARIVLEEAGWSVRHVPTYERVGEALAGERPQLVIAELILPNPFTQIERLVRELGGIPVIAVTSFNGPGTELDALQAGCSGYLRKPIDTATFATQLLTFLGERP